MRAAKRDAGNHTNATHLLSHALGVDTTHVSASGPRAEKACVKTWNVLRLPSEGTALRPLIEEVLADLGWRKLEAMQRAGIYAAVLGVACEARLCGLAPETLLRELEDDDIRLLAGVVAAAM